VWSADPKLGGGAFLKINGIAFDGHRTLYTTNYSTGELFAVRISRDGSAGPAVPILLDTPMTNPDGIRWRGGYLYVAENPNGLSRIDPRAGTRTLIDGSLDQPTSLVFVGRDIWVTEGQVLRLQAGEPPNLPFKVVRAASALCSPAYPQSRSKGAVAQPSVRRLSASLTSARAELPAARFSCWISR
jgi:hypothetical protein